MALDFTFLKKDQIWGNDALEVMKRYGTKVAPTDLTVILGAHMTESGNCTSEGDSTCISWSASPDEYGSVRCVYYRGDEDRSLPYDRSNISARPALHPSEASKISHEVKEARVIDGSCIVEYGEYPQTVADKRTSEKLEGLYKLKRWYGSTSLCPTGKKYTFDSIEANPNSSFKATSYQEYEMDGKRYIRVYGRFAADSSKFLSTGEPVEAGKLYWVEVQPIEWLVDESGWMVSKKCLFSGIQFDTKERYYGDFSKTFMKHYLDTYFAKEMKQIERVADKTVAKIYKGSTERKGLNNILKALDENMEPTQERQKKKREFVAKYRETHPKKREGR